MATSATPAVPSVAAGSSSNMDVDYVIIYRFATTDKQKAAANFEQLIAALFKAGLATEVRVGDSHSLLIFVRAASPQHLQAEVYRSRAHDWLHGVRTAAPKQEVQKSLEEEPLYEAERLRIIYQMITNPVDEGGAGVTPKHDPYKQVESIFALHDHTFNKKWIKKWSTSYRLTPEDLDSIRDQFGEKIAFYFAFTQSYFTFLAFPAAFGFVAWLVFGHFSPIYALGSVLWCLVFTEYWKHQEADLAIRWGVKGVSKIEHQRTDFKHEKEATDPVTGEQVRIFPSTTRLYRQLLQIPFAVVAVTVLGSLITTCFSIEIFMSEIYNGPLKWLLVFLPTGILTTAMPILLNILTQAATRLNDFENYENQAAYDAALTGKIFVLNFITSYLPIFLTAFVYVPFAKHIVPYLDVFSLTARPFAEHEGQLKVPSPGNFNINPSRLRKQVIYFTVTAQIVNLGLELILPYVMRKGSTKLKQFQSERAMQHGGAVPDASEHDNPEETAFLQRVRQEATLGDYDVTSDLREMVVQFGYLSLFSVVWPLTGCSFLVNNWLELRADAMKICVQMKRPIPARADTIGPWLQSLTLLTWLGSLTTSALVYMFMNDDAGPNGDSSNIKTWALLLTVFFSEHIFLVVRIAVRTAIGKIESPGSKKERRERYLLRQQYLGPLRELKTPASLDDEQSEAINRTTLEERARQGSLKVSTAEERFWARQVGWKESATVGVRLIERSAPQYDEHTKKEL